MNHKFRRNDKKTLATFTMAKDNTTDRFSKQEDTVIDTLLDRLRDVKPPVVVEVGLLVFSCLFVTLSNTYNYYFQHGTTKNGPLELMTQTRQEECSTPDLHVQLLACLGGRSTQHQHQQQDLVSFLRGDAHARRLASRFQMAPGSHQFPIYKDLQAIWHQLLELPPAVQQQQQQQCSQHKISLIIPAFNETNDDVLFTVSSAYVSCQAPQQVQVIVVDAGLCSEDLADYLLKNSPWASGGLQVIRYKGGGGRGPTMNYGAKHAVGTILFFLHSDTRAPEHWDRKIIQAFNSNPNTVVHASCFCFDFEGRHPLTMLPIRWMINVRTRLFKLPYGDQGIAMPALYFDYIGGFPEQSMMEDFDLMCYLRRRAQCLPENLAVISGPPCQVSARRWQKAGAAYVTLANAYIVYRYTKLGWMPDDVFDYYYNRPAKKRA
jgi:glycosyltransferase involved in cell wall biosynthesis